MAELMYIIGSLLIFPALIFSCIAQAKVMGAFNHFKQIGAAKGMTGAAIARRLLDQNGCGHVEVISHPGKLSDHYDPRAKTVALSDDVFDSTSIAAIGIAAHEVGHAIQDQTNYAPLKLRQVIIATTGIVNKMLLPMIIAGLLLSIFVTAPMIFGIEADLFWLLLMCGLCGMYLISFLVNLITLPTEFNASKRAKKLLAEGNFLYDDEEKRAVSKVLSAAAMTYVAALVTSLAFTLRFLGLIMMTFGNRRR